MGLFSDLFGLSTRRSIIELKVDQIMSHIDDLVTAVSGLTDTVAIAVGALNSAHASLAAVASEDPRVVAVYDQITAAKTALAAAAAAGPDPGAIVN